MGYFFCLKKLGTLVQKGYIDEVDLECPKPLHDKYKERPPCPESLTPNIEWFNDYRQEIRD